MAMCNPPHPGEIVRDCMEAENWTVTECARRLGVARHTLSRLLNAHTVISPSMALALERLGWNAWVGATLSTGSECKRVTSWLKLD